MSRTYMDGYTPEGMTPFDELLSVENGRAVVDPDTGYYIASVEFKDAYRHAVTEGTLLRKRTVCGRRVHAYSRSSFRTERADVCAKCAAKVAA